MKLRLIFIALTTLAWFNAAHCPAQQNTAERLQNIQHLKALLPTIMHGITTNQPLRTIEILPADSAACTAAQVCAAQDNSLNCNARITYAMFFNLLSQTLIQNQFNISNIQAALTFLVAGVGFIVEGLLSGYSELTSVTLSDLYPTFISILALFVPVTTITSITALITYISKIFLLEIPTLLLNSIEQSFINAYAPDSTTCDTAEVLFLQGILNFLAPFRAILFRQYIEDFVQYFRDIFLTNVLYDLLFIAGGFNVSEALQKVGHILMTDELVEEFIVRADNYLCELQIAISLRVNELTCGGKPIALRSQKTEKLINQFGIFMAKLLEFSEFQLQNELKQAPTH